MKLLVLLLSVLPHLVFAQRNAIENYEPRWQTRVGVGVTIPLNSPARLHTVIDKLVVHADQSTYLTLHSSAYFITPQWGLELCVLGSASETVGFVSSEFNNAVNKEYAGDYFIKGTRTTVDYEYGSGFMDDVTTILVGPVYKLRKKRLLWMPKLQMGIISRNNISASGTLKQPDSHRVMTFNYKASSRANDSFIIAPTFSVCYQIGKRWMLSTDLGYAVNKSKLAYTETIHDLLEEKKIINKYNYSRTIHTLNVGVSIYFSIFIRPEAEGTKSL